MSLVNVLGRSRLPLGMDIDGRLVLSDVGGTTKSTSCKDFSILDPAPLSVTEQDMTLDDSVRPFAPPLREYVRSKRFIGRKVALSPPSEHVVVRQLTLPPMPDRAIKRALQAEVGRRLQLPFDDPLIDYAVIPRGPGELPDSQQQLLVVAVPREQVLPWVNLSTHVGLRPVSLEPGIFAVVRMLSKAIAKVSVAMMVVLGNEGIDLGLVVRGVPQYTRFVGIRAKDYTNPQGVWDKPGFVMDVGAEVDRSIAFMNFNVLGGTREISQVFIVDKIGCTQELVRELTGRINQEVVVPAMPYAVTSSFDLGDNLSSPSGVEAEVAAITSVSVALTLPEVRL